MINKKKQKISFIVFHSHLQFGVRETRKPYGPLGTDSDLTRLDFFS